MINNTVEDNNFLPNLFILGAAKCGTTTLYRYLSEMNDVCMSIPKEPFFFEAYWKKGISFYKDNYFSHWKGEPIIGEARHRNLILPYIPERIFSVNPNATLIIIVRDPVKRAYSHWYHNFSRGSEHLSFKDAIADDLARIQKGLDCSTDFEIREHIKNLPRKKEGGVIGLGLYRTYLDSGYYYEQICRYLKLFNLAQIKLILFEEMVRQPEKIITDLAEFLNLDNTRNSFTKEFWENKKRPSQLAQTIDEELLDWLRDHYRIHNSNLSEFFNVTLDYWE